MGFLPDESEIIRELESREARAEDDRQRLAEIRESAWNRMLEAAQEFAAKAKAIGLPTTWRRDKPVSNDPSDATSPEHPRRGWRLGRGFRQLIVEETGNLMSVTERTETRSGGGADLEWDHTYEVTRRCDAQTYLEHVGVEKVCDPDAAQMRFDAHFQATLKSMRDLLVGENR